MEEAKAGGRKSVQGKRNTVGLVVCFGFYFLVLLLFFFLYVKMK